MSGRPSSTVEPRHENPVRIWWLTALVHAEALARHPWRYAKAAYWKLVRKRLRSRSQFAPLLGKSRKIYDLWMARHEAGAWNRHRSIAAGNSAEKIFVVLDCRDSQTAIEPTLAALRKAGAAGIVLLIGADREQSQNPEATSDVRVFPDLRQLAAFLASHMPCWAIPIEAGDQLSAGALDTYRSAAEGMSGRALIYADSDEIGAGSRRTRPHFKPGWNPELFGYFDYLSFACAVRLADQEQLDLIGQEGDWVRRLVSTAALDQPSTIKHLPLVLHHRGTAQPVPAKATTLPILSNSTPPNCTIIIPTHNQRDLLETCVNSLKSADYPGLELLVIDHDSDDPDTIAYLDRLAGSGTRVAPCSGPFNFSAMNNAAVGLVQSELICFLNNDVEALDGSWLSVMARQAIRPDIGAVGAKLLYPDRTIQHAGVVLGINGGAGHAHRHQPDGEPGYFGRAHLPQFVSAVTAACMVVQREKFLAVEGFDEAAFPVAFNDVDLCMKLNARGWQSLYEPRATLIHHESKSRGKDHSAEKRARFAGEFSALQQRWHTGSLVDPFHHPELSCHSEQFVIRS